MIAEHDVCFRDNVARFQGVEQNNPGDGFFATFDVPSAALNCALAFQAGLVELAVQARVGIHMGESVRVPGAADSEKLLGLAVDTAGRVMSLAKSNQILITRHAFDSARQNVLRGPNDEIVVWRAHGPYIFKGLDQPIEIHEAGVKGVAPLSPPDDSEKARRAIAPGDEETLGWRPAAGLGIPTRSGWTLDRKLGAGGFGEAWLAISKRTRDRRAFKFCFRADRLRSLKRELTLFRILKDSLGERDDIARLYDVNLDTPPFFLELEFTPAGSLDAWSGENENLATLSIEERARFVAEVATALGAAHSVGVLHKDVKPANILVRVDVDGAPHARLTDFGIGQLLPTDRGEGLNVTLDGFTEGAPLTDLGSQTGTRVYMAPELFANKPASIASDVYALGVLLYQMVVGDLQRPLAHGWERDVSDPLLVEDIAACVAGNPAERPVSCELVAAQLRSLAERRHDRKESIRHAEREASRAARLRFTSIASLVLLIATITGVIVAGILEARRRDAEQARQDTARALDQVMRLADSKKVSDLEAELDDLWPVTPARAPAMAAWMKRVDEIVAHRADHAQELASLRLRAEPYGDEQRRIDHKKNLAVLAEVRRRLADDKLAPEKQAAAKKLVADLQAKIAERVSWTFDDPGDDWRFHVLSGLVPGLDRLAVAKKTIVARHESARTLRGRSIDSYRALWDKTVQSIANSKRYGGMKLQAQQGLVPLGPDPVSGLFEFAQLDSGSIPSRDASTKQLVLTDDFALVLVLIPGGTFNMGAQNKDANAPNYDPQAEGAETPLHSVTLSRPYFLSKYECTRSQWERLTNARPSQFVPGGRFPVTPRNPVDSVSHDDCTLWLRRHGLVVPTEAMWEFACRAGTHTPWFTGRDRKSLANAANVADAFCKANGGLSSWRYNEDLNDGFAIHAPVGSFAPNLFGLYDVHGNQWEWCRDTQGGNYDPGPATDPIRTGAGPKVIRGGAFTNVASDAGSARRSGRDASLRDGNMGIRPARLVHDDLDS